MKIWVDFFKPSGKWYAGGQVEIGNVGLWEGRSKLLETIWTNQNVIHKLTEKDQWTVVSDDLYDEFKKEDYHHFYKAVLQVGRE